MRILAQTISIALHPLCMPLLTLMMLLATDGYLAHRLGLFSYLFVLLFINTIAPAVSLWMLKRRGVISDYDIRSRRERPWPFLLVLAYYTMAYVLVVKSTSVDVPIFYQQVMLSLVAAIGLAWVVTWKAKISMHMLAQGGILGVYLHVAMVQSTWNIHWLTLLLLSAGLVGWSRLYLGAHTARQVYSGFGLGLVAVWVTLL